MSLICKLFGHSHGKPEIVSVNITNGIRVIKLKTYCSRCNTIEFTFQNLDEADLEGAKTRNRLILSDRLIKSAWDIANRKGKQVAWQKFEDALSDCLLDNTGTLKQLPEEIFKARETFTARAITRKV